MPFIHYSLFFFVSLCLAGQIDAQPSSWLRINQLGYLEKDVKVAVLAGKKALSFDAFELRDALTHERVFESKNIRKYGSWAAFSEAYRLDFSAFATPGAYYVQVQDIKSPVFRINNDVYDGAADFILRYMRQQRSGYNPYLDDSCHTQDGFIIYHPDPAKDSTRIDVAGGWHDASDYLQYLPTSANAVFQMLFAYRQNPDAFGDAVDASGRPGANGIPDILDEAKWGLDWMLKMNPGPGEYYNQIADDRDHQRMRLPTLDSVHYGAPGGGLARPVYLITGEPQGAFKYKNRTKGVASSAGKFASAFALGNQVLKPFFPEYAEKLIPKAAAAYEFGRQKPGYTQTAPCRAPYFYEEENWVDDMELAAAQLDVLFPGKGYREQAAAYGRAEPITPWMGSDTARHYQWYPFLNLGHYFLTENAAQPAFLEYMRRGVDSVYQRGKSNAFLYGVPFIWCSNNLVVAIYTQARLYRERSGDGRYREMEAALRDWLFGCNPWGTSMICGLPADGVYPRDPHSAFTHLYNYPIDGGLVDGPIYGSIWNKLIGITLYEPDEFAEFQSPLVVYHDDYGDYSSDEPTMDGTASLSYMLSGLQMEGNTVRRAAVKDRYGAIVRGDTTQKMIHLVFTGHEHAEGVNDILKTLKKAGIKAGFFLTGDFCRRYPGLVRKIKKAGHYIGPHSDKHLLYCDWQKRDSLLVTKAVFMDDLRANIAALAALGVPRNESRLFIPPFEWHNDSIAAWSRKAGMTLLNYSPGTLSHADYTTPAMKNYRSSEVIYKSILDYERNSPNGLNGFYLLMHVGAGEERRDKFYGRLGELIGELKGKGYVFRK